MVERKLSKRLNQPKRQWSELHQDILETILKKLCLADILRFKSVCSSWNSNAQSFICSNSSRTYSLTPQISNPWLIMLPNRDYSNKDHISHCRFFNLCEKRTYCMKEYSFKELVQGSVCVGSSYGWLIILDRYNNLHLLNPFSGTRIGLPSFESLPKRPSKQLREIIVNKAILLSDPSHRSNYVVVIICDYEYAYYKNGDDGWTDLLLDFAIYGDITSCGKNQLYALSSSKRSIEVWDFKDDCPVKRAINILPRMVSDMFCPMKSYIVVSKGKILLVDRIMQEKHASYLSKKHMPSWFNPYLTNRFHVYKLDYNEKQWEPIESLNDHALFLGGNQSISVCCKEFSDLEEDSIYFSDDYWLGMYKKDLYGGHDNGVYDMKSKSVKQYYGSYLEWTNPLPVFIFPNP